ncbi:MAG: TolC family protein [Thermoanaerobaculales bacterium]|jgi:outer membrane protein|nr:TolC family protein [Thermoanaerobaculales bacterium]
MRHHHVTLLILLTAAAAGAAAEVLPIDSDRAVELVLATSHRRDAAAARVDAADQQVGAADARRLPTVDLEAAVAHRSSVPEAAFPESVPDIGGFVLFPNIQDTYRAGVALTQPVWTGGAINGSCEAARHDRTAAAAEAARVDDALRLEARTAYWNAVAAEASLDAARAEAGRAERLLADARALRGAGMAVRADELGAAARLAAAQVRVIDAEAAAANRRAELRSLLDLAPGVELELTDRGGRLPSGPPALAPLIAEALATRPELAALAARRDALASRSATVGAPARPQVSLGARWDVARPNERYLPLSDEWNTSWTVGVFAGWRVFDGARTGAEVATLDAERSSVEAELAELERRVALDVETARRTLEATLAADTAATAAVEAATAREADSRDRYGAGMATVAEVLDAQTELAEAELTLVRARSGAWIADAGLRRAVGR